MHLSSVAVQYCTVHPLPNKAAFAAADSCRLSSSSSGNHIVNCRSRRIACGAKKSSKKKKNGGGIDEVVEEKAEELKEEKEEEGGDEEEKVKAIEDFPLEELKYLWGRGWAPWEEVHPPENHFALKSLGEASLENPRLSNEVMDLLDNKGVKKELTPVEFEATEYCDEPLVFSLLPPRDWPPPGWKVDPKELAFIRETHTMYRSSEVSEEEDLQSLSSNAEAIKARDDPSVSLERWKLFLKQYKVWVEANKETLDKEALLVDPEYSPGRRRTGENYSEGMLELPFIYPGQHYLGMVVHMDLHDGAFVNFGAVHDGWVCIQDNDWFKLRHIVQIGSQVHVEVIAKRDPYRYRFPIELRLVNPNIDRDIFRRFKHPPIISRPGDKNLEELARETGRPYPVELEPTFASQPDPRDVCHPYIFKVWQLYAAESLVLDDEESKAGGDEQAEDVDEEEEDLGIEFSVEEWKEYRNQGLPEEGSDDDDSEDDDDPEKKKNDGKSGVRVLEPTEAFPRRTYIVNVDPSELDLDAARKEREMMKRGEQQRPRRERLMEELESMHRQRCEEEEEALMRDIACRREAGLPVEDARFSEDPWHPNKFNPLKKIWQADYIGDPKKWKYSRLRRDKRPRHRMTMKRSSGSSIPAPTTGQQ